MSRQYLRNYSLEIQTQVSEEIQSPVDPDAIVGATFTITELRLKFQVVRDATGEPNIAKIDIYNLSFVNRSKIQKEFAKVVLNVGYENNLKLLFKGDIRNVTHIKQGVDDITTLFAVDGNRDLQKSFTNVTFNNGATAQEQVSRVIQDFKGLLTGNLLGLDKPDQNVMGVSYAAPTNFVMDILADKFQFDWSIQDEQVVTVPLNGDNQEVSAVITSETGLLGSPEVTEEGVNVTTLLNPAIKPHSIIEIQSEGETVTIGNLFLDRARRVEADGFYTVRKVTHTGDTHDSTWQSAIMARTPSRQNIV
jgi:hypothetical protein